MPPLPEGERALLELALEFWGTEEYVMITIAEAAVGGRREAAQAALEKLAALRLLDYKEPVVAAYLFEHPWGNPDGVKDLAASLAKRLDQGAQMAAESARAALAAVNRDNVPQIAAVGLTAHLDNGGRRWGLGPWARMNTETIGRTATSRGLAHRVGEGNTVTVSVGQCGLCQSHAGQAVIGQQPLPPYHPSCSCTASA